MLKRLETNADIDPTIVEIDKKRYLDLLNKNPETMIAGRSVGEILKVKRKFFIVARLIEKSIARKTKL